MHVLKTKNPLNILHYNNGTHVTKPANTCAPHTDASEENLLILKGLELNGIHGPSNGVQTDTSRKDVLLLLFAVLSASFQADMNKRVHTMYLQLKSELERKHSQAVVSSPNWQTLLLSTKAYRGCANHDVAKWK